MKIKILLLAFALVSLGLMSSCNDESPSLSLPYPEIDFDAIYILDEEQDQKEYLQILLRMSLNNYQEDIIKFGLSNPEHHQKRLHYFLQDFKTDLTLVSGQDHLSCIDAHFERPHMDLPYRNFILTFKHEDLLEGDYLLINDKTYSGQILKLSIRDNHEN